MDSSTETNLAQFLMYTGKYEINISDRARLGLPLPIRTIMKKRFELANLLDKKLCVLYYANSPEGVMVYDAPTFRTLFDNQKIIVTDYFPTEILSGNRITLGVPFAEEQGLLETTVNVIGAGDYFLITK